MYQQLAGRPTGLGSWRPRPGAAGPSSHPDAFREALCRLADPIYVVEHEGGAAAVSHGAARLGSQPKGEERRLLGYVPPLLPSDLGDPAFRAAHGIRAAYVAGPMANGIASVELVEAMARDGLLGIYGAAGLHPDQVEAALVRLQGLGDLPWGANLIHSPEEPAIEEAVVQLFLRHGLRLVEASAYLDLTLPIVRYRVHGIHRAPDGTVVAPNRVIAKVSRREVAAKFLSPPPEHLLRALVERGELTEAQAQMAATIPMAEDITAEADSGGHTDNRPLVVVLPAIQALRDELHEKHRYAVRPRVGAGGGVATPASAAAAFAMGAAYLVTGSVNQGCVEAGTSDLVRELLAGAASTDVTMAPAADMFEMGVKLQVLSKGTLFPVRAARLYDLYRSHDSLEALPEAVRKELEDKVFRAPLAKVWEDCKAFFARRDPKQIERAEGDPKHRMALVFRSYLGQSSTWANEGVADRRLDFQIWCGPAMGAFNDWARGSFLEDFRQREAAVVAKNLLHGAAALTRLAALRSQGVAAPQDAETFPPQQVARLEAWLRPSADTSAEIEDTPEPSTEENSRQEPIAIVGMAALFPHAEDLQGYWRLLLAGEDAVGDIPKSHFSLGDYHDGDPAARDKTYATRGAFLDPIDFDPTEFGIPPSILEATDTSQLLSLVVAKRALEDAGYGDDVAWDKGRASVLLGVTGTQELVISLGSRLGHPHWRKALQDAGVDEELAEEVVERIGRSYVEWQENSFPGLLGNVVAGRIANRLDLGGTNNVVDAACASSLAAIHMACMELWTGKTDLVLSGGVDALSDIFMHMCFSKTPALSPTGDARPFSDRADGIVLGEGVGMVVLKRLSDAQRDGDRIHAVIRGIGTSSDGRAKSIYAPLPAGQERALRAAYQDAAVEPSTIGLVEGHGTGTSAGDACEVEALAKVYRESIPTGAPVALGSVKSQIGHTKAAAGAAGLIKAALALEHKVVPPTLKVDAPHPKLAGSPFHLPREAQPWLASPAHPRRAAVSSFGFGGSNFHVVLEEAQPLRPAPAWDGSVQIVAKGAESPQELERWLDELAAAADLASFAASSRRAFRPAAPHRLLLVVERGADLPRLVAAAKRRLAEGPGSGARVHYGVGPTEGALALLFPGQGSQGVGMLRGLANVFPEMLAALESAPSVARLVYPPTSFDPEGAAARRAELVRTDNAQQALGLVERGALEVLRRFGVGADLFAGHSYGELVALHAAGRLEAQALHLASKLRGERMAGNGADRGTMLAVHAPLDEIEALLEERGLDVVLANRNTPAQGVISGSRDAIEAAQAACAEAGLRVSALQVGAAFHSPLVADAAASFHQDLEDLPIHPGQGRVIANTTAAPYPDDEAEARKLLAEQLAHPVRWVEVVERLYEEGARTFVEVGPRAVLTGLVRSILDDRPHAALPLDAQGPGGQGLMGLATLLAELAARGHPIHLEAWEAVPPPVRGSGPRRTPKMRVPLGGANYRAPHEELPPRQRRRPPAAAQPGPAKSAPGPTENEMKYPISPEASALLLEALRANGQTLEALQRLQEQSAAAHHRFLETQGLAQASFHQLLLGQQRLLEQAAGLEPSVPLQVVAAPAALPQAPAPAPIAPPVFTAPAAPAMPGAPAMPTPQPPAYAAATAPAPRPVVTQAAPQPAPNVAVQVAPSIAPAAEVDVVALLLQVVAESTGYPQEMLELDMDLESDLGIDSIKRVEILSQLSKQIPDAPRVEPEQLGGIRTLRQVAEMVQPAGGLTQAPAAAQPQAPAQAQPPAVAQAPAPQQPVAAPAADPEVALLEVVAELTGYPQEMLELDMDLESDLGIDSIKRVEILSTVSKRIPGAPHVEPERLGDLRTLRHVLHLVAGREHAPRPTKKTQEGAAEDAADPHSRGPQLPTYEVHAVALPAPSPRLLPAGEVWITEDGAGLAAAIADACAAKGLEARVLTAPDQVPDGAPAALLVLGSASDDLPFEAFAWVRGLAGSLRQQQTVVFTVARRDGAFGRLEPTLGPVSHGALAGLAKTLPWEWEDADARALDVSALLPPAEAAEAIVTELLSDGPSEVGIGPTGRLGLALEPASPEPQAEPPLQPGDLVVVSGGARGVTATCLLALAERVQPSFLLLGRTELPAEEPSWLAGADTEAEIQRALLAHRFAGSRPSPRELGAACAGVLAHREIRSTLAALRDAGSEALYLPVDVTDPAQVEDAVAKARATYGEVRGVVHGAGVLRDKRIEEKTDADFRSVLDTKVQGLDALLRATRSDELRLLALFSSVSGRFGRRGQVDYAMANEVLVAAAHREAALRPDCHVIAFDWGPWQGGMVSSALAAAFEAEGIGLIPYEAGARIFAERVLFPSATVEWVVGSGWPAPDRPQTPWIATSQLQLDVATHPYLDDHRLDGKAVLPVVMMIEAFASALPGRWDVEDFRLLQGVVFSDAPRELSVWRKSDGAGGWEMELRGAEGRVHAKARLRQGDGSSAPLPDVRWQELPRFGKTATAIYGDRDLFHGPRFQGIDEVLGLGTEGVRIRLRTSPTQDRWIPGAPERPFATDPLLLDGVFQAMVLWCRERYGTPSLPSRLRALRLHVAALPEVVEARIAIREADGQSATADCVIVDEAGELLATVEGYVCVSSPTLDAKFRGAA